VTRLAVAALVIGEMALVPLDSYAAVRDGFIGAPCDSDVECAPGLNCLEPTTPLNWEEASSYDVTLPGGACSPCPDADEFEPRWCLEPCSLNSPEDKQLDPAKCHGRDDMACVAISVVALPGEGTCEPRCSRDDQCAAGRSCDRALGVCSLVERVGDGPGTECEPAEMYQSNCRGRCEPASDELFVCREFCVISAPEPCAASDPNREAACLLPYWGRGAGDLGECLELCNCSSDCPDATFCEPWNFGGSFDWAGACRVGPRSPDAPDCLDPVGTEGSDPCPYGAIRACRTADGCFGSAECLSDGSYAECVCAAAGGSPNASSEGGAAGAVQNAGGEAGARQGAAPIPRLHAGCGCRTGPSRGLAGAWLALLSALVMLGFLRVKSRPYSSRTAR